MRSLLDGIRSLPFELFYFVGGVPQRRAIAMFVGAEIRGSLDNGPSLGWTSHYRALLTHFEVAPNVFIEDLEKQFGEVSGRLGKSLKMQLFSKQCLEAKCF